MCDPIIRARVRRLHWATNAEVPAAHCTVGLRRLSTMRFRGSHDDPRTAGRGLWTSKCSRKLAILEPAGFPKSKERNRKKRLTLLAASYKPNYLH